MPPPPPVSVCSVSDPLFIPFFLIGFPPCKQRENKNKTGTTGDLTAFDIELRGHDSDTATTGCGEEAFASLCTHEADDDGGLVCMDSDGSYDVQVQQYA